MNIDYYVYTYIDSETKQVYYIGKGRDKRALTLYLFLDISSYNTLLCQCLKKLLKHELHHQNRFA